MRQRVVLALAVLAFAAAVGSAAPADPSQAAWPLSLRNGLPRGLPGWEAAPSDPLPREDENEMGPFVEVSRFFQRIEGPTVARQFRLVVQDYGSGTDIEGALRDAYAEAAKAPGVEFRVAKLAGRTALVVTDRSGANPTSLVTVVVLPGRIVLGQGANVKRDDALKLVEKVDFDAVAAAK